MMNETMIETTDEMVRLNALELGLAPSGYERPAGSRQHVSAIQPIVARLALLCGWDEVAAAIRTHVDAVDRAGRGLAKARRTGTPETVVDLAHQQLADATGRLDFWTLVLERKAAVR